MVNKLILKKARAKNFRSIGNQMMELDFLASKTTLIASESNGAGKSTLCIWLPYFVLFGKPYHNSSKKQGIVNSRSNKDCVGELEFETRGSQWLVRRGIKPNIFEVYQDGVLVENEAALGDMQSYLESIIGLDERAFMSIVALGVRRFVPFCELKANERRSFVEQMLDLIVISDMNEVTKKKLKEVRREADQIRYDIGNIESKKYGSQRTLSILEDKKEQRLNQTGAELDDLKEGLTKTIGAIEKATKIRKDLDSSIDNKTESKLESVRGMISRFEIRLSELQKNAKKVVDLHDCPTCKQGVSDEHKRSIEDQTRVEIEKLETPLQKLKDELADIQEVINNNDSIRADALKYTNIIVGLQAKQAETERSIKSIESKMVDANEDELIHKEKEVILGYEKEVTVLETNLEKVETKEKDHEHLLLVLKDDGVKANIVTQYLPFLNSTINNLLDQMNLYVQINIDSEFNISMFSPNRKGQTIDDLSTGQLRRIDLAVLIAWREIAKNKASADCNVLILDEILENLSASGVEEFMEMWESIGKDTNLIVVSQRASEFDPYFERSINYALKDDMTVIV